MFIVCYRQVGLSNDQNKLIPSSKTQIINFPFFITILNNKENLNSGVFTILTNIDLLQVKKCHKIVYLQKWTYYRLIK